MGAVQVGRPPSSGVIPPFRMLDFDHFRTKIGQMLAAPWTGQDTGEINNADAL